MLGVISGKREYYYRAKWISNDNRNNYGYFTFRIVKDDNAYETDVDNISGLRGDAVWETKSNINFEPEDIVYFRGQKFHIKNIDGNRKAEPMQEQAFMWFKNNGNLVTTLQVRKAGYGV